MASQAEIEKLQGMVDAYDGKPSTVLLTLDGRLSYSTIYNIFTGRTKLHTNMQNKTLEELEKFFKLIGRKL